MAIEKLDKKTRMDFVERLLLEGYRLSDIYEQCHKRFGFTRARTKQYVGWVEKYWKEPPVLSSEAIKEKYRQRMELIVSMAIEAKELGTAVKAQDILNKMIGAYSETQAKNDGPGIITISDYSKPAALPSGRGVVIDAETKDPNDEGTQS